MMHSILLVVSLSYMSALQAFDRGIVQVFNFTLPDAVSGDSFSLSSLDNSKAIVVVFTSNYCPYAKLYHTRLKSLVQQYKGKSVNFVLINSNNPSRSNADNIESMSRQAEELGYSIPYLSDSNQKVADMFGAQKTPEVFLLVPSTAGQYKIVYEGAIDDNPQVASDVDHHFLQEAIEDVLNGRNPRNASAHPTGCMIKR